MQHSTARYRPGRIAPGGIGLFRLAEWWLSGYPGTARFRDLLAQGAFAILPAYALKNRPGFRTDTVERLLGRRPRTFADWCARNANAFQRPSSP